MSAVFFQDSIGLITFDEDFAHLQGLRARIGKGQVIQCLDAYQHGEGLQEIRSAGDLAATLAGFMRKTSLVPVVSDFLFEDVDGLFRDLAHVHALHDIFVVLVEADFAFELPTVSAGWIEAFDVETGRSRVMSRRELRQMAPRVRAWQDDVAKRAKESGFDVLRLSQDQNQFDIALLEWVAERRLRRR
jgi:hypothetical protein